MGDIRRKTKQRTDFCLSVSALPSSITLLPPAVDANNALFLRLTSDLRLSFYHRHCQPRHTRGVIVFIGNPNFPYLRAAADMHGFGYTGN